ncbi:hypothetical protein M0805_006683 [Coniferiporia weirii]|nr:hypothetical protein M0805_006683 [Coniferiporia weirii]
MVKGFGKDGVLPENPKWLTIDATDGDARRWPSNTAPNPDAEGHVNFMAPLSVDHGQSIKWRLVIGKALAEMLEYPDKESKNWVLKAWPAGYQFYDHNKGQLGGAVRHDLYLVGSEHVARFRSPPEFIPHAFWLMTDPTRNRSNCYCKYCARRPQRDISSAFGLTQHQGPSPSQQARVPTQDPRTVGEGDKLRRLRASRESKRVFAMVQRVAKHIRLPKGPKQFVVPEREKDLRAALGPKTLGERRWARSGELVWVKLDKPVMLGAGDNPEEAITFWPGLIDDVHFKAEVIPKKVENTPTMNDVNSSSKQNGKYGDGDDDADNDAPWTVVHKWLFKIKLLVVLKTVMYGSDHILPYQSHAPDSELLSIVQSVYFDPDKPVDEDAGGMVLPSTSDESKTAEAHLLDRFKTFDPFPASSPILRTPEERMQYHEAAAGAFAVAIQIASRLTMFWTPSDAWDSKMFIPTTSQLSGTSRMPLPPPELQALGQRLLGTQTGTLVTQTRFQGLWWGPEQIWMGELVRLKLARYQLAPEGADMIKKPSGAGKSGRLEIEKDALKGASIPVEDKKPTSDGDTDMHNTSGLIPPIATIDTRGVDPDSEMKEANEVKEDADELGAAPRSVFMRVDGLFVAHVPREDGRGVREECRMSGMVYELADDDWESDEEEPPSTSSPLVQTDAPEDAPTTILPTGAFATEGSTSLAQVYNTLASQSAPAASTSVLFEPNPALLSVDPADMDDVTPTLTPAPAPATAITDLDPFNTPPATSLFPSTPTPPALKGKQRADPSPPPPPPPTAGTRAAPTTRATANLNAPPPQNNPQLSGPLKAAEYTYPLPPAPSHMRFRPILRAGREAVMPLTLLAGRYYPKLLSDPLLRPRVHMARAAPHAPTSDALWALEGLVAGAHNAVDACRFVPSRVRMMHEAERQAWSELVGYWRRRIAGAASAIVVDD